MISLYGMCSVHFLFTVQGWWLRRHDDVIKWKNFPRYWPFVRGIHRSLVNSPHKGQWRGALMFSLICAWINGWVNNGKAGDLRLHCAHYDVIVICPTSYSYNILYCSPSDIQQCWWGLTSIGMRSFIDIDYQCTWQTINSMAPGRFEYSFRYVILFIWN